MIIDGKAIAAKRLQNLKFKIKNLKFSPKLVAVLVGNDPGSEMYVKMKSKRAAEVGITSETCHLSSDISKSDLTNKIRELNKDASVTGILVQLPLPGKLQGRTQEILDTIDPLKDVDCLTSKNLELLKAGNPRFLPATVNAVLVCIDQAIHNKYHQNPTTVIKLCDEFLHSNKRVSVIGQGKLVGKPLADYLESQGVKVKRCDECTVNLSSVTRKSDILVVATGVAKLITANMVKRGVIVIDCGAPDSEVDFSNVSKVAEWITPVPGGVGPLTVVSLLENTFLAGQYGQRK